MTNDEIYYAPVEIESAEQMAFLGITRRDCVRWRIGVVPVLVYLMPAEREVADYLKKELERKYSNRSHEFRCRVPGKRKSVIFCPLTNRCSECPYGRCPEDRESRSVSLDSLVDEGFDCAAPDLTEERADARAELEELLAMLREENPDYVKIVELLAAGFSVAEIASSLHTNVSSVYRSLKKIRSLAKEYRSV